MSANRKVNETLRNKYLDIVKTYLTNCGEEVLTTNSNEICLPCVNSEGDDDFVVITFKVPTGSREGDIYDGYAMAEDYAIKTRNKQEKALVVAQKKAEKIARDKAMREAKAKAKAEREAKAEK